MTVNGWSNLEITLTGLRKFTRYGVTVSAFNGVSAGPASLPVSAITQEGGIELRICYFNQILEYKI